MLNDSFCWFFAFIRLRNRLLKNVALSNLFLKISYRQVLYTSEAVA